MKVQQIKKIISALLVAAVCMSMVACTSSDESASDNSSSESSTSSDSTSGTADATDQSSDDNGFADSGYPSSMPEFETTDMNGNVVTDDIFSQADLTVVNFWATYCNPCINEMPDLAEWANEMPDNVQLIGVIVDAENTDSEEYKLAQSILDQTGAGAYTNLLASEEFDDIISDLIGVPTTFFVDSEGNMAGTADDIVAGADVDAYKKFVEDYIYGEK